MLALHHTLMPHLLEFNWLPSRTLHPERRHLLAELASAPAWTSCSDKVQHVLHQCWSQALLRQLGTAAEPIHQLNEPTLPLALLASGPLQRLTRYAGLVLLGRRLRHTIDRRTVLALRDSLGDELWHWSLGPAAQLHPGLAKVDDMWWSQGAAQAADTLGAGLLAHAWSDAPLCIAQRANWKLPPCSELAATRQASELDPVAARHLCLQVLQRLEPQWLSCFPATP